MSNQKVKVIYSLKVHIELLKRGFSYLAEMKNPHNVQFNCWVYEETEDFLKAFDEILKGEENFG